MSGTPGLQDVAFEPDGVAGLLAELPPRAGVAQLLDASGNSLLIGQPANLRRWAAAQLGGAAPRRRASRRPRIDLRPVARALRFRITAFAFEQRLAYERLMALHVPLTKRRDLRVPGWLRLDLAARFPRVDAVSFGGEPTHVFGPFRDRKAAAVARDALHKELPLRPCDYAFEPDPGLALGLNCLYAQVRSCAAPCLARVSEEGYRALAEAARDLLSSGVDRALAWRPAWVSRASGDRALIAERGRSEIALFPVRDGFVLDAASTLATPESLEESIGTLAWPLPTTDSGDWPWLSAWLHAPRRKGVYLVVREGEPAAQVARRLRRELEPPA